MCPQKSHKREHPKRDPSLDKQSDPEGFLRSSRPTKRATKGPTAEKVAVVATKTCGPVAPRAEEGEASSAKLDRLLRVRVSKELLDVLDEASNLESLNRSAYVRQALAEQASKDLATNREVAAFAELGGEVRRAVNRAQVSLQALLEGESQ